MYRIYSSRPVNRKGTLLFPDFFYARTGLQQEATKVKTHYRINKKRVDSSNPLVSLLYSITAQFDGDIGKYVRRVSDETNRLTQAMRFTNDTNTGDVFNNVFFGGFSNEIILTNDDPFSLIGVDKTWRDLTPITVLRHPFADTNMVVFNNDVSNTYFDRAPRADNENIFILNVNIPMLALQYVLWFREMSKPETKSQENIMTFIATYPILNMVPSWLDYALLNRFIIISKGLSVPDFRNQHVFGIINYQDRIDRAYQGLFNNFKTNRLDYASTLMTIPTVFSKDMFDVVFPPFLQQNTKQVMWAKDVEIMPAIDLLTTMAKANTNVASKQEENRLRIAIKDITSDQLLANKFNSITQAKVMQRLEKINRNLVV